MACLLLIDMSGSPDAMINAKPLPIVAFAKMLIRLRITYGHIQKSRILLRYSQNFAFGITL